MSIKESKIKHLVREFLLDEGILRNKISDPKIDFGFQFAFPPGVDKKKNPIGQAMAVFKPKDKELIIIQLGTQISQPHVTALNSLKEKEMLFFIELRKFLLLKNLLFRIDVQNHRYEISEQIFISKGGNISKNSFYKNIRKVFSCAAYCNMILGEFCSGKVKPEDFSKSKNFGSGSGFSLYS